MSIAEGVMRKIALEEHFSLPWLPNDMDRMRDRIDPPWYARYEERLGELAELRLAEMDDAGIEVSVLSLTGPGAQTDVATEDAVALARRANDDLARHVAAQPRRFAGFAHLPMQSPADAMAELDRCVGELGFKGALINGHTQGVYLDDERYRPFWSRVQALEVPVYLHPANMVQPPKLFEGYPWLGSATWGWMNETGGHALRLVMSGLFERFPGLTVILGHMGEALPFLLWRIDSRYATRPAHARLPLPPSAYIRRNIMITTSGVNDHAALACSLATMGADRVMFSVDYPFELSGDSARFIERAPLPDAEKAMVAYDNAARLLKL